MKKFVLTFAVAAALAATSCAGGTTTRAKSEGVALKTKIENCTSPDSLKKYARQVRDYTNRLVRDGKKDVADAYMRDVMPVIKSKEASMASKSGQCCERADMKVRAAEDSVKKAADKVKAAAVNAKDKTVKAVKKAEKKTADAVSGAVDKAGSAVDDAASKTADKIKEIGK